MCRRAPNDSASCRAKTTVRSNASSMPPCSRTSLIVVPDMPPPELILVARSSLAWNRRGEATMIVPMPQLTVEGFTSVEVEAGKRLVLAIEQDAGVDVLHACGGNARCTTCRVEFIEGEPETMTVAERGKLEERGLSGIRLSCQIVCDHD